MNKNQVAEVISAQYSLAEFVCDKGEHINLLIEDNPSLDEYALPVLHHTGSGSYPIADSAWDSIIERHMKKGKIYSFMSIEETIKDLNATKRFIPADTEWKMYLYEGKVHAVHSERYAIVSAMDIVDAVFGSDDVKKGYMEAVSADYTPDNYQIVMEVGSYITSNVMTETVGDGYINNSRLYINTNDIGTMALSVSLRSKKENMLIGLPVKKKHIGEDTNSEFITSAIGKVLLTAKETSERITYLSEIEVIGQDNIMDAFDRAVRKASLNDISKKGVDKVRQDVESERASEMTAWEIILSLNEILNTEYLLKFSRERMLAAEIAIRRLYDERLWDDYK